MSLEAIAEGIRSPDNAVRSQAEAQLVQIMENPQCINLFLQAMAGGTQVVKELALSFLPKSVKRFVGQMDNDTKASYLTALTELVVATDNGNYLISLVRTFAAIIASMERSWDEILRDIVIPCWAQGKRRQALLLLDEAEGLSCECVGGKAQEVTAIIEFGFQSNDWGDRAAAVEVFVTVLPVLNGVADLSPYWQKVVEMTQTTDFSNDEFFKRLWHAIGEAIAGDLVSSEVLNVLYQSAITVASCEALAPSLRYCPLRALLGLIPKLDGQKFAQIVELNFRVAHALVEIEATQAREYVEPVAESLRRLPGDIYVVLKSLIQSCLMGNAAAHVVVANIIELILVNAPETAYQDADFLMDTLLSELDIGDVLVSEAVCWAVSGFDQSFTSIVVYIPRFLPKLIPFLVSSEDDLRQAAKEALHDIVQKIDSHVDGLFRAFWEIREQIRPEEFSDFAAFLSSAIEKSSDFGDAEMETLVQFVLEYLSASGSDFVKASEILDIVNGIISHTDSLIDTVFPAVSPVVDAFFSHLDATEVVENIDPVLLHIESMFKVFGSGANERYGKYVDSIASFALDEDTPENLSVSAFGVCCTIAKVTGNAELACRMQEKCSTNLDSNDGDLIVESLESTSAIAKLLPPSEAKQLFMILLEYLIEVDDPEFCSLAIDPLCKMLSVSSDANKTFFLQESYKLVSQFTNGELVCMNGVNPTEGKCDHALMAAVINLITKMVRTPSEHVDQLCTFCLSFIKSANSAVTYSVVGACSEAVKYGTCSKQVVEQLLALSQSIMGDTKDPDLRQNITYLMNVIIQKFPDMMPMISQFLPVIQYWLKDGLENPVGNQLAVSNIASFILQFVAAGGQLASEAELVTSIAQIPPFDAQETVPMIQNLATILTAGGRSIDVMKQAALAISKVIVMNEGEKPKHHITPEVNQTLVHMLGQLFQQNAEIAPFIQEQYANSKLNLAKLMKYVQQ